MMKRTMMASLLSSALVATGAMADLEKSGRLFNWRMTLHPLDASTAACFSAAAALLTSIRTDDEAVRAGFSLWDQPTLGGCQSSK